MSRRPLLGWAPDAGEPAGRAWWLAGRRQDRIYSEVMLVAEKQGCGCGAKKEEKKEEKKGCGCGKK
jgi:hypothetical protein